MFNKKLRKRIRSLEDFLGIVYRAPEDRKDWDEDISHDYGFMEDTNELIKGHHEAKTKKERKTN